MRVKKGIRNSVLLALAVAIEAGCGTSKPTSPTTRAGSNPQPAVPAENPAPPVPAPAPPANPPANAIGENHAVPRAPAAIVIPPGTVLRVRLDQEMDTRHNRPGDRFSAALSEPVIADGMFVLPVGTRFHGHVTLAKPSGWVKGRAELALRFDSFTYGGTRHPIRTAGILRESGNRMRQDLATGGGPAAAIGAAVGTGMDAVGVVFTGRKQVYLRAETPLALTLRAPVKL